MKYDMKLKKIKRNFKKMSRRGRVVSLGHSINLLFSMVCLFLSPSVFWLNAIVLQSFIIFLTVLYERGIRSEKYLFYLYGMKRSFYSKHR